MFNKNGKAGLNAAGRETAQAAFLIKSEMPHFQFLDQTDFECVRLVFYVFREYAKVPKGLPTSYYFAFSLRNSTAI